MLSRFWFLGGVLSGFLLVLSASCGENADSSGINSASDTDSDTDAEKNSDGESDIDTDHESDIDTEPVDASCAKNGDATTTLFFENRCSKPVSFEGSRIDPGLLGPSEAACRNIGSADEEIPSVRYWGYIGPDPGGGHYTLAELTLNTDFNDFDWYNISHVDAHNLPMAIVPLEMPSCRTLACASDLLDGCPLEGEFRIEGELVACVSPQRDNPDSPVAQYFEAGCADAYSWSGDDAESMAACAGEDYAIVFCP